MALSTEDAVRLAALKTAYDALLMGQAVTEVTAHGRTVKYGQADKAGLKAAIDELEARAAGCGRRRGAITFRV